MSRRDAVVIFVLLAALAILAGAVAAPSFAPTAAQAPSPSPAPAGGHVEGVVGRPSSITPVTARTQVDRDLVALLFRGLVRLGAGTSIQPDLAESWTVDKKGARWTFRLRDDASWHDGTPVTSDDVVFTIGVLQHPDYVGPLAAAWAQVKAVALDEHTVRFDLGDPVGGFLQAATLPILPAHLLADVPVAELSDSDFARWPTGNGSFALVDLSDERAILEPVLPQVDGTAAPLDDPGAEVAGSRTPRLASLELRFHDTPEELAAAFAAGDVDAAADLLPAEAMDLAAATDDARALRYPTSTLTALAFNLRTLGGPFSDQRTRRALLAAIDRDALIADVLGGAGARAATPIPPSSWAYDPKAAAAIPYDRAAAVKGLKDAGWKRTAAKAWVAPGGSKPLKVTLIAPDHSANPLASAAADRVAAAWRALGLATTVEALAPGEFVDRLRTGDYAAAVIDVNLGLDPDPYAILASTQAREDGSNVTGIQDATLDKALLAARAPGTMEERRKAYAELQRILGTLQPMPPLFFRDSALVAGSGLSGPVVRPVADPGDRFWDVVRWAAGR